MQTQKAMSIQTLLSFDGKVRVPEGRVKKLNNVRGPTRDVLAFLSSRAVFPVFRGKPTSARRVAEIGPRGQAGQQLANRC